MNEEFLRLKKLALKNHERALEYFDQAIKVSENSELTKEEKNVMLDVKEKVNYIKFPTPYLHEAYKRLSLDQ